MRPNFEEKHVSWFLDLAGQKISMTIEYMNKRKKRRIRVEGGTRPVLSTYLLWIAGWMASERTLWTEPVVMDGGGGEGVDD